MNTFYEYRSISFLPGQGLEKLAAMILLSAGGGPEQGFQRRFADGLNQTFTSVCGADTYSQVSQFTVWLQIKVVHYLNIGEGPLYL